MSLQFSTLDILFPSIQNIYKSLCGLYFWTSDPLIDGVTKIFQLKGLKPKNKGHTNFYECCDLTKKLYLAAAAIFCCSCHFTYHNRLKMKGCNFDALLKHFKSSKIKLWTATFQHISTPECCDEKLNKILLVEIVYYLVANNMELPKI